MSQIPNIHTKEPISTIKTLTIRKLAALSFLLLSLFLLSFPYNTKSRKSHDEISCFEYPERDLNPHNRNGQRILSPSCLPFHHFCIR